MTDETEENRLSPNGHLAVDEGAASRRRHKSESALPGSPTKSPANTNGFLNPNYRKASMYESRSTISGVKFDDPFIGKMFKTIYIFVLNYIIKSKK